MRGKKQHKARAAAAALAVLFTAVLFCGEVKGYGAGPGRGEAPATAEKEAEEGTAEAVNAAYGYKNSPVAMEASYGYDNMAKGGRYLPVYVTLTNQKKEPFSGSVMVKSMEADFDVYEYEYPVELEGEATIQMNLNIPLGLRADQLYVRLYDREGSQILQKRLKMNIRQDTPELLIGTLSDSQDRLEYLNDVGILHSTLRTRTCTMVAGSIPWQAAGLDQLDVLLISNYDIRRLSTNQTDTIKEWVSRGGILLLGTGAGGQEAVETFLENDLEQGLPEPEQRIINMGDEFAIYGPADVRIFLDTTQVAVKDGNVVLESLGFPVLTAIEREKGMIAAAAFDFCEIDSFCEEHSYVDKLFTNLLGEERILELAQYLYDGGNNLYWAVQSMINSGSADKLPNISLYAVVISSYILLAGPGLYFFLKHRDLRSCYGRFVVLLSVCCSGMIYLMSSRTRFEDTFFNYASIRDYSPDTVVESTYMNMRTPYNRPYGVNLDASYDIRPLIRSAGSEDSRFLPFTGEEKTNMKISFKEQRTRLSVQDVESFSPHYFRLEKREENGGNLGITGSLLFFDGKLSGTVTNRLGIDLEQAAVFCSNAVVLIGEIKAGETVSVDDLPLLYYPLSGAFAVADRITGGDRFEKADISSQPYMKALKRSNLLEFYLENFHTGYLKGARAVAFSAQGEENKFLLDEGREVDGVTMYTASVEVSSRKDGQVYHTFPGNYPTVVSGTYRARKNTMDGLSPLTLEYSLGRDIAIEKLTLVFPSEELAENGNLSIFDGDIYFYNYETDSFDKMDSGQREFITWQLEPYLSGENKIMVRYAFDTPREYMLNLSLPVLTTVGRD